MTTQHVDQVPVATDTPEQLEQLQAAADDLSTAELTAYARTLGITPPTPDSGWEVLLYFQDDTDTDGALTWVRVTEPDDAE